MSDERKARIERRTNETDVTVEVFVDGRGDSDVSTGVGFFDHMLDALARHSGMDVTVRCAGDLGVDDHHTIEDCAIVLGEALRAALGDRRGVARFGWAYAPLDESLARSVVDLSGRPFARVEIGFVRERLGDASTETLTHFFETLAMSLRCALHVDVLRGSNDHHRVEAAFKSLALALRQAVARDGRDGAPSTKGVLS